MYTTKKKNIHTYIIIHTYIDTYIHTTITIRPIIRIILISSSSSLIIIVIIIIFIIEQGKYI